MADGPITVGMIGLGAMGSAMAANLVAAGHRLVAHDAAGTAERAPTGAIVAASVADVAADATAVVLSLPDGVASATVVDDLLAAGTGVLRQVIDTSTIGVDGARRLTARTGACGVAYIDAPVSGGVAGARARSITTMVAGDADSIAAVRPVLDAISARVIVVGDEPGMGQAVKLANNFLSATALAATSEVLGFVRRAGLDPEVALEVINASSGRSMASADKFPRHVLTGTFDSGFRAGLMAKDVGLYLEAAEGGNVASVVSELWQRFAAAEPAADFTRIAEFVAAEGHVQK